MRPCRILLAAILLPSISVFAQQISPKNKHDPRQIVVDVVVTDSANQPVTGLHEQDFQIFENNKRQQIQFFHAPTERAESGVPQALSLPPNTFTNANSSKPDSISIILLDQLNTSVENQELARQSVMDFLSQKPAAAAFAIFTLRNDDPACVPFSYAQWSFGITHSPITDSDWSCSSRGRLLLVEGITEDKDRLLAALNSNLARPHPAWLRQKPYVDWTVRQVDSYPIGPPEVIDTSMSSIAEIGDFLRKLPGRKNLIWMSDSFDAAPIAQDVQIWFPPKFKNWERTDPFSPTQMIHLTADRLAVARVALYPVDLTGKYKDIEVRRRTPFYWDPMSGMFVALPPTRISRESEDLTQNEHFFKLTYMASQTGGKAFHGKESVQEAIDQAVSDESNYYALRYSPTNTKYDSKIRSIKVTVAAKDCHLAYRKAYFADDPSTLNRPGTVSPDIYLAKPSGLLPWTPVRVSGLNPHQVLAPNEPILAALKYGAPESNDIVFTAHVEPTGKFVKATAAEMEQLQENESFTAERAQKATATFTKQQKKSLHKGGAVVDTLPPADRVFLQPYSINYLIDARQLTPKDADGQGAVLNLEVAVLVYDALGQRVAAQKDIASGLISAVSGYHLQQKIKVPDRATLLRLAVRDVSRGRIGSLEIPLWAISSPYRRKQLQLPPATLP